MPMWPRRERNSVRRSSTDAAASVVAPRPRPPPKPRPVLLVVLDQGAANLLEVDVLEVHGLEDIDHVLKLVRHPGKQRPREGKLWQRLAERLEQLPHVEATLAVLLHGLGVLLHDAGELHEEAVDVDFGLRLDLGCEGIELRLGRLVILDGVDKVIRNIHADDAPGQLVLLDGRRRGRLSRFFSEAAEAIPRAQHTL